MKRRLSAVLIIAVMLLPAAMAHAESPVYLSHTLFNYTDGMDPGTLRFLLHVKNPGNAPLYNLMLSYEPSAIISRGGVQLYIGNIEAGGSRYIPFSLITPMLLSQEEFLKKSFSWAGEGFDEFGNTVYFSVESRATEEGI